MIRFFSSRFAMNNSNCVLVLNSQMGILRFDSSFQIICFSTKNLNNYNEKKKEKEQSFTVSYLTNSFGASSKTAESVSKYVSFETPERPDSILLFLKDQGFTISQISAIIKRRPRLLLAKPTSILPKLEFLRSIGASSSDLSVIITRNPDMLFQSLDQYLIPCYDILKRILDSDEKVIKTLKRLWIFLPALQKHFIVNSSLLRQIGTPQSYISDLVAMSPRVISLNVDKFAEGVKKIMEIGLDPSKYTFVAALIVFLQLSDKTWEHKLEVYRRCGFSEDEIWSIFRKQPSCLSISEKNLMSKMNFLVRKMGRQPADVTRSPVVLCGNLETRVVPRCIVARVLLLKGLIKEDVPLSSLLVPSEKMFLEKFVFRYQEKMPQLLDLFQGEVSLAELGFGFDEKSGILGFVASQT